MFGILDHMGIVTVPSFEMPEEKVAVECPALAQRD
jgi:hypothetical protein